ncbi:MAG: ATPase, T2SS/T4P/T4SS family [Hyphomicrobium sp.]|jgi:general secretion pathway protein E
MDRQNISPPAEAANADPRSAEFVEKFGAFLHANSYMDELAVRRAQRAQRQSGERFDLVIMRLGLLQDGAMAKALAVYCSLRLVTEQELPNTPMFAEEIDPAFLKANRILPLTDTDNVLELAVADPFNSEAIAAISYLVDREVALVIAADGEIQRAIERLYGAHAGRTELGAAHSAAKAEEASDDDIQRLEDMASEAPVIRLVQDLIVRAVNEQASDIHIEPREDCVRVRVRLDGLLHTIETLPISMRAAIGSRIKIMARLNIAERRLPQDGRIKVNVRGREIDLRVSTMPTLWGESIVLRILDRSSVELDFKKLGFGNQSYDDLRALLAQPNGIILVTGPTGSGKTTTLYTALSSLNSAERKVFTVEDPIEYQLAGVNQIQVQPKIGLTFAAALRSILRQDPDIIMVGEIRDLETAQIAIQAALTGHLVLSTVHTNSAAATLTRLLDMGVEKYLLASTVKGVLAQRLVRRLCPGCAQPSPEAPRVLRMLESTGADCGALLKGEAPRLHRSVGCPSCRQTGFSGRTTIYELLTTTPEITDAILSGSSEGEIEKVGMAHGMTTMLQGGLVKVLKGETTPEEVMRVTRFDACLDTDIKLTTNADR